MFVANIVNGSTCAFVNCFALANAFSSFSLCIYSCAFVAVVLLSFEALSGHEKLTVTIFYGIQIRRSRDISSLAKGSKSLNLGSQIGGQATFSNLDTSQEGFKKRIIFLLARGSGSECVLEKQLLSSSCCLGHRVGTSGQAGSEGLSTALVHVKGISRTPPR